MSAEPQDLRPIAVAIPCFNEAAAIGELVEAWSAVLPDAEIIVFDNNSTDATALIAQAAGARVVEVPRRGKGYAVQAIFKSLSDRPAVLMTDGDGTYPPHKGLLLLTPVLEGRADMVVGSRQPITGDGGKPAMAPIRGLGNVLIRGSFAVLLGRGPGDLLSGYRVFGPRMLAELRPRSSGFEIETELTGEAVARGYRVVEVPVPYLPRVEGTVSKLRAGRDGLRILTMILRLAVRLRPWRVAALALLATLAGWTIRYIALKR